MMRIEILFEKFYNKTATDDERKELAVLIGSTDDVSIGKLITRAGEGLQTNDEIISEEKANSILKAILKKEGRPLEPAVLHQPLYIRTWFRFAAAAAVVLITGLVMLKLFQKNTADKTPAVIANDVLPGTTGATLRLDDGRVVQLDSSGRGLIALQSGTEVKLKPGSLEYNAGAASGISMNTLSTPRGKQFSVVLPDGSRVWINAASSITYPSQFTGSERKVSVQGEAYFDVKENVSQPFVVNVNNKMDVKVLGTAFNVNSYEDEAGIATTLVNGAVEVNNAEHRLVLHPGEQAILNRTTQKLQQSKAGSMDEVIAWKENNFYFENSTLPVILRQFARWYDVEVICEGPIKNKQYLVMMSRNAPLSKVLQVMQAADIKFRIEGKKLYVQSY